MLIQVACGEVLDKLGILELKYDKLIKNDYGLDKTMVIEKVKNIENEIKAIKESSQINIELYAYQYKLLKYINRGIMEMLDLINYNEKYFEMENSMKSLYDILIKEEPVDSEKNYNIISRVVVTYNDIRYNIKKWINIISSSTIIEEKTYNATFCKIIINNKEEFYEKLPEINHILIRNYNILIEIVNDDVNDVNDVNDREEIPTSRTDKCTYSLLDILGHPNIYLSESSKNNIYANKYGKTISINEIRLSDTIRISEYNLSPIERKIFEYDPINYIAHGAFGDYIQEISIICEMYYKTGRKANLYIGNEFFYKTTDFTYNDTYSLIMQQKYINDYKKYDESVKIDINLSVWRKSPLLYKDGWNEIFNSVYNINWGFHKWISIEKKDEWKNTIFINILRKRVRYEDNMSEFIEDIFLKFSKQYDICFISPDIETIDYFKSLCNNDTINKLKWYRPENFNDLCTAINSCHLLIGCLSGILTIAHACHIPRYILLLPYNPNEGDNIHNFKFNKHWNNVAYTLQECNPV
jgi:hypothetical protein